MSSDLSPHPERKKGLIFVVSAPSGAGKTSLCHAAAKEVSGLDLSVSYTTRPPRAGEVDGVHYHFVTSEFFQKKIDRNEFVEWAQVHGHLYGTPLDRLMEQIDRGIDMILDIDSQGAMQIKKRDKEGVVFIYILPPSFEALKARLMERNLDSAEEIARRLKKAREEIWNYRSYYYLIVNDRFERALEELKAVILAERIKMKEMSLAWIEETFIRHTEG